MLRDYLEQIKEADLVLVGIGRELQAKRLMDFKKEISNPHYQELIGQEGEDAAWMREIYERDYLLSLGEVDYFKDLEEALEGKNYFVVTAMMTAFFSIPGWTKEGLRLRAEMEISFSAAGPVTNSCIRQNPG